VLLLAPFPPRLDAPHGGGRSIARLVLALARRNRVALGFLRTGDEPDADPEVVAACALVHEERRAGVSHSSVRPLPRALAVLPEMASGKPLWVAARWNAAFQRWVGHTASAWRPHIVQAEFSAMGQYLDARAMPDALRVLTLHEPGAPAALDRRRDAPLPARPVWSLSAALWARYERRLICGVDATVVFTDADRRAVLSMAPDADVATIPLGAHVPRIPADPIGESPPSLLFVGNFVHPPNLDAARWLVEEIFPLLQTRFPLLKLLLVGGGAPDSLRRSAGPGVTFTGWVPDVEPYLQRAALVVAPLRTGGGMRVKVLEAMAAGKAVVATPRAVEGLSVVHGEQALVAPDADGLIDAISAVLRDPAMRTRLARTARAHVEQTFGWDRSARDFEALYERVRCR
jgi:polysaccharide biosynthesis protein PslH